MNELNQSGVPVEVIAKGRDLGKCPYFLHEIL